MNLWFLAFMLSLFCMNAAELTTFFYTSDVSTSNIIIRAAYVFIILTATSLLGLSLSISNAKESTPRNVALVATACGGIGLIVGSDYAISGAQSIGYSITRVASQGYWIFQAQIAATFLAAAGVLAYNIKKHENSLNRRHSLALLIGVTPLMFTALLIGTLMSLGYRINAAIFGSISTNIFLAVLLYTHNASRLFNFLSHIPTTEEHTAIKKLRGMLFGVGGMPLKEIRFMFEREAAMARVLACNGNKSEAARQLGISRATLLRKL